MKRVMLLLLVLSMLSMGCASATIDTWADRGLMGLTASEQNIDQFTDRITKQLQEQREADLDALFDDILTVAQGKIEGAEIDEEWVKIHRAALRLLLELFARDEAALRTAKGAALDNLDQVAEAFAQIKRLRRSWGPVDELQAQVDHLATLVGQVIANQRKEN